MASSCKKAQVCARCGEGHRTKECPRTKDYASCVNCGGSHPTYARSCPALQSHLKDAKEAEAARQQSLPANKPATYANVTQTIGRVAEIQRKATGSVQKAVSTQGEKVRLEFEAKISALQREVSQQIQVLKQDLDQKMDAKFEELKLLLQTRQTQAASATGGQPVPAAMSPGSL